MKDGPKHHLATKRFHSHLYHPYPDHVVTHEAVAEKLTKLICHLNDMHDPTMKYSEKNNQHKISLFDKTLPVYLLASHKYP